MKEINLWKFSYSDPKTVLFFNKTSNETNGQPNEHKKSMKWSPSRIRKNLFKNFQPHQKSTFFKEHKTVRPTLSKLTNDHANIIDRGFNICLNRVFGLQLWGCYYLH